MAGPVAGNQIARRVIDDLIDFSGETSVRNYMKFFFEQEISERRRFINRMREEAQTSRNLLAQLTALIVELEASSDPDEVFDTLLCLRDDVRDEKARLGVLDDCITQAEEQIETKEEHVCLEFTTRHMWFQESYADVTDWSFAMLSEVVESPSLGDKMKYVFGRSRSEDGSLAELEALGEVDGAAKSLEHIRTIVGRDAVTLRELEAL
nr:hypothetical protein [Tanacetum cinerariifolium]